MQLQFGHLTRDNILAKQSVAHAMGMRAACLRRAILAVGKPLRFGQLEDAQPLLAVSALPRGPKLVSELRTHTLFPA